MTCHDEGTIMAYIDEQFSPREMDKIKQHLELCDTCSQLYRSMDEEKKILTGALDATYDAHERVPVPVDEAWKLLQGKMMDQRVRVTRVQRGYGWVRGLVASLVLLSLMGGMLLSQMGVSASEIISLFRGGRVKVLTLSARELQELAEVLQLRSGQWQSDFAQIVISSEWPTPQQFTWAEVKEYVAFDIVHGTLQGPVFLHGDMEIEIRLEGDKSQGLWQRLGIMLSDWPKELLGQSIWVKIPPVVEARLITHQGRFATYIQTVSPQIIGSEGTELSRLQDALMSLPMVPLEVRQQLAELSQWGSVLPVPVLAETAEQIEINGYPVIVGRTFENYLVLVWQDGEVIRLLTGAISQSEALLLARELLSE